MRIVESSDQLIDICFGISVTGINYYIDFDPYTSARNLVVTVTKEMILSAKVFLQKAFKKV